MSDLGDMTSLFGRLGIPYMVDKLGIVDNRVPTATQFLEVPPQFNGAAEHMGYHGFVACFFFDAEGKYLDFGVWE